MESKEVKKYFAIAIVLLLVGLLLYAARGFITGFFGALILYTLFYPLHKFFVRKGMNRRVSALLIVLISIFVIFIPLVIFLGMAGSEVLSFFRDSDMTNSVIGFVNENITKVSPYMDLSDFMKSKLPELFDYLSSFFIDSLKKLALFLINVLIMYFSLYYMLIQKKSFFEKLEEIIPFNKKNSRKLTKEFREITYTTVVTTGLIGVIQGALIGVAFWILGINGAFFWGVVAAVLSFFPVIGPVVVWVPAAIIQVVLGKYGTAAGVVIAGIIISTSDNLVRPYLQSKIGKMHPLITLVGIFIGVPLFGILGVIIGPLLISYVFLTLRMIEEEYGR